MEAKLTCFSNSCKNSLVVHQPTERHLDALKADLPQASIHHHKMTSSHGSVDLLAQLHHGRSEMSVGSILVTQPLLEDLLLLGLETVVAAMVAVEMRITEVKALATMLPLLATLPHGLNKLLHTQLLLHTQDMQLLATPAVILPNKPWELHLALPHLLD
jgi:hypothetical protein